MDILIRQCPGVNDFEAMAAKDRLEIKYIKNLQGHVIKVTAPRRQISPTKEDLKTEKKEAPEDSSTSPTAEPLFYINFCDLRTLYEKEAN